MVNYRKKWFFGAIAFLIAFLIGGVLLFKLQYGRSSLAVEQPPSGSGDFSPEPEAPSMSLKLITSPKEYSLTGTGAKNGYYYMVTRPDEMMSANIKYIDYASGQDIYLTSQIASNHQSAADESYIASTLGGGVIMVSNQNLFFMRLGVPEVHDTYGENSMPQIYRMALNGANRELVYSGVRGERLLSVWAADEKYLYGVAECLAESAGNIKSSKEIVRIHQKNGEKAYLAELPNNVKLVGAFGKYLVFYNILMEGANGGDPDSWNHEVFVFALDTNEFSLIKSWNATDNNSFYIYDHYIVTVEGNTHMLTVTEISSSTIVNEIDLSEMMPIEEYPLWFDQCIDDCFLFADETFTDGIWAVNLFTGEKRHVTLSYFDSEKGENRPVEIVAKTDDQYLVIVGKETITSTTEGKDGTMNEVKLPSAQYALIAKEDYLNSIPNYQYITHVG